ncbi:hypothetical protein FRX31_019340 [Thalictrum thalictroides]|uniref:RNase H type-1 domain-containing protein n=1 Tax=Thalictrum thalictroides TaxID=46969 RepID=A0A7J6W1L6_THATH|nr:hypothetical protein FRX31_019340 [Thalictrum thalictroides]
MEISDWIKFWFKPYNHGFIHDEYWAFFCVTSAWYVWKSRCTKVFQDKLIPPHIVATQIDKMVFRLNGSISDLAALPEQPVLSKKWVTPMMNNVKINVDISFLNYDTPIGIGYVIRSCNGSFLYAGTECGYADSPELVECYDIFAAVQGGVRQQLKHVELETDNLTVANYLAGIPVNLSWQSVNSAHCDCDLICESKASRSSKIKNVEESNSHITKWKEECEMDNMEGK